MAGMGFTRYCPERSRLLDGLSTAACEHSRRILLLTQHHWSLIRQRDAVLASLARVKAASQAYFGHIESHGCDGGDSGRNIRAVQAGEPG